MKTLIGIVIVIALAFSGWFLFHKKALAPVSEAPKSTAQALPIIGKPATADSIVIDSPKVNDVVSSPIKVSGKARGTWFFEASAPVIVLDINGNILGRGNITATGDWMTTNFVPFTGTIDFVGSATTSDSGAILFMNDNPSGQASTSLYMAVPVYFSPWQNATSTK